MKERQSKLDAHAERLDEWFGIRKLTIEQAQAELLKDGLSISQSRLSTWWAARQSQLSRNKVLADITSGSRDCKSFREQFENNPAPDMRTIVNLYQVLVMQFSTRAEVDPKLLQLADSMMRTAMEYNSGQTRAELEKRRLDLAERRVKLLEAKAAAYDRAQAILKNSGGISPATLKKIEAELKLL